MEPIKIPSNPTKDPKDKKVFLTTFEVAPMVIRIAI